MNANRESSVVSAGRFVLWLLCHVPSVNVRKEFISNQVAYGNFQEIFEHLLHFFCYRLQATGPSPKHEATSR